MKCLQCNTTIMQKRNRGKAGAYRTKFCSRTCCGRWWAREVYWRDPKAPGANRYKYGTPLQKAKACPVWNEFTDKDKERYWQVRTKLLLDETRA